MKRFREGQEEQVLDTLFFDFIDLAKKLQPKVVIAENVKGLLIGEAKSYVARIYEEFANAGYYVQHWLLDGQNMGLPQRRERVFFVCLRNDLAKPFLYQASLFDQLPRIKLEFNSPAIPFCEVADGLGDEITSERMRGSWEAREYGDSDLSLGNKRVFGKSSMFNSQFIYPAKVCPTLAARKDCLIRFDIPRYTSKSEVCCISSFPQDYDFAGQSPHYICGMSVPPIMMAQVSHQIYEQWLSKIN